MYMKKTKPTGFFALGILAVVLAGCYNPITIVPPKELANPLAEPFSVEIMVGEDAQGRFLAGLTDARIKVKGIAINVMQLIVVDKAAKTIAGFDEVRLDSNNEDGAILRIDAITYGRTYDFMLLMGNWKKDGETYVDNESPTLLATGLQEQLVSGGGKITITMWPLVVDTEFTTTDTEIATGERTAAPVLTDGKPAEFKLFPVDWKVTWKVLKGTGGDGFSNLVAAQKVINPGAGDTLVLKSKNTIIRGAGLSDANTAPTITGSTITLNSIETYTAGITRLGTTGSVNFKLEYIPFNLTTSGAWKTYNSKSAFVLDGDDKQPVWIIRNGLNDLVSNAQTNFITPLTSGNNGNGAVAFTIAADAPVDPTDPQSGDLIITAQGITGIPSYMPIIQFTTSGYTDDAQIRYAIVAVPQGETTTTPPSYQEYTKILKSESFDGETVSYTNVPSVSAGSYDNLHITLPVSGGNYDVYVRLLKGGKVSNYIKINTVTGWIWLETPWGTYDEDDEE
jgi:hypothetical protein